MLQMYNNRGLGVDGIKGIASYVFIKYVWNKLTYISGYSRFSATNVTEGSRECYVATRFEITF